MNCRKCKSRVVKNGKIGSNGKQRFFCSSRNESFIKEYSNHAFELGINTVLINLLKEGCGTSSISRLLDISKNTVKNKILKISRSIPRPSILMGREYEVDEMYTFIGNKENRICITYALDRKTKEVVSFSVGRRNKRTLGMVVNSLLLSNARQIRTDKCVTYLGLIPKEIHHVKKRGINYIERKNLTLRTHIKRLNRRTIAYSKSLIVLSAVLKIYFWS
jgi:IS1 family transposase/transposase-like protein